MKKLNLIKLLKRKLLFSSFALATASSLILAACGPNNATPASSSESTSLNSSEEVQFQEFLKDINISEDIANGLDFSNTSEIESGKLTKLVDGTLKKILTKFADLLLKIAKDEKFQKVALDVSKLGANVGVTKYLPEELNSLEKNIRNYINGVTVNDVKNASSSIMTSINNLEETFKNSKTKSWLITAFNAIVTPVKTIFQTFQTLNK